MQNTLKTLLATSLIVPALYCIDNDQVEAAAQPSSFPVMAAIGGVCPKPLHAFPEAHPVPGKTSALNIVNDSSYPITIKVSGEAQTAEWDFVVPGNGKLVVFLNGADIQGDSAYKATAIAQGMDDPEVGACRVDEMDINKSYKLVVLNTRQGLECSATPIVPAPRGTIAPSAVVPVAPAN